MARTNNLTNYLTDVAQAIKDKKGDQTPIQASSFDTEIANLPSGGDISEYFASFITSGNSTTGGWINSVKKLPTMQPSGTSLSYAFSEYKGTRLDITGMNTKNITDMTYFINNSSIQYLIGYQNINTSNVTTMKYMFYKSNLTGSIDLGNWNMEKVTDMSSMFQDLTNLSSVIFPVINGSKNTTLYRLFFGCSNLVSVTANINTYNVTAMNDMFYNCSRLTEIKGINQWRTYKVSNLSRAFQNCSSLSGTLNLSGIKTNTSYNCSTMFNGCSNLTTIDLRNLDIGLMSNGSQMFNNCSNLKEVLLGATSVPSFPTNMFNGSGITATSGYIYVPDNMVSSFKSASGWSTYANRIHGISEYPISE